MGLCWAAKIRLGGGQAVKCMFVFPNRPKRQTSPNLDGVLPMNNLMSVFYASCVSLLGFLRYWACCWVCWTFSQMKGFTWNQLV